MNKTFCEMCGKEFIKRSRNQRFCGYKGDKGSCSYKNIVRYSCAFTKRWRKTEKGRKSLAMTALKYWTKKIKDLK